MSAFRKHPTGYTVDTSKLPEEALAPCSACARSGGHAVDPDATCGTLCQSHMVEFEAWLARYPRLRLNLAVTAPRWTDGPRLVAIDRWIATLKETP